MSLGPLQPHPLVDIHVGEDVERMRALPARSVHAIVTSPPFWKDRDYKVRGQVGQEPTLEQYVNRITRSFEAMKHALRDDGTVWMEMGDRYVKGELVGVPWTLAFAIRDCGWSIHSAPIWTRSNARPERVTNRPARDYSSVFLFAKKGRPYYYDRYAVMVPASPNTHSRGSGSKRKRAPRDVSGLANDSFTAAVVGHVTHRNLRTTWHIPLEKTRGDHFSAYPRGFARVPILASTSARGCCPTCGAPHRRLVRRAEEDDSRETYETLGWEQACPCAPADPVPCTVLDPFGGSGTTCVEALALGRRSVMIELHPETAKKACERVAEELSPRPKRRRREKPPAVVSEAAEQPTLFDL
jgi:site-specific DNA-methyltransferase (adenine-specific)